MARLTEHLNDAAGSMDNSSSRPVAAVESNSPEWPHASDGGANSTILPLPILHHPCAWCTPRARLDELNRAFPGQVSHSLCTRCERALTVGQSARPRTSAGRFFARLGSWVLLGSLTLASSGFAQAPVDGASLPSFPDPVQIQASQAPGESGRVLHSLQVGFAALQIADLVTTERAIHSGNAVEGNVLMAPLVGSPVRFVAFKSGLVLGTVLLTNHIAKRSKLASVLLLATVDSVYAMAAVNNLHAARTR
jgi:hypothetical protein